MVGRCHYPLMVIRLRLAHRSEDSSATGIHGEEGNNNALNSGAVYVYRLDSGTWTQQAYLKASNTEAGDQFGSTLSLSADGNKLVVGAYLEDSQSTGINNAQDDNTSTDSGAVYVFGFDSKQWSQEAYIKASNTGNSDYFGYSVSLSADGNSFVVGALNEDSSAVGVNGDQEG